MPKIKSSKPWIVGHTGKCAVDYFTAPQLPVSSFGDLQAFDAMWHLWPSDRAYHYLPEGFELFTGSAKPMWFMWNLGNRALSVGPYSAIKRHRNDLKPLNEGKTDQKKQFDKIAATMNRIYEVAQNQFEASGGQGKLKVTIDNVEATFDAAYPVLIAELYSEAAIATMNPHTMCCTTLCKNIYKRNALMKKAAAADLADLEE